MGLVECDDCLDQSFQQSSVVVLQVLQFLEEGFNLLNHSHLQRRDQVLLANHVDIQQEFDFLIHGMASDTTQLKS